MPCRLLVRITDACTHSYYRIFSQIYHNVSFGHGFGSLVEFLLIKKFEVKEGHPKGGGAVMLLRVELLSVKGVNRKERDSDTRIDH